MNSCLYECRVLHARIVPRAHRFSYRLFLFGIDLDELPELDRLRLFSWNRRNLFNFREADYLPNDRAGGLSLKARVVQELRRQGCAVAVHRVFLLTLPRIAGYLFNPVSFYFCYAANGEPVAALPEVTNTFREMKPYALGPEARWDTRAGVGFRRRVTKHFYVSPFSDVDVAFEFILRCPGKRVSIQIDDHVGPQRTLTTTLRGDARALTDLRLAWFFLKYPFLSLQVISRIHWQALLLWLKGVRWYAKAERPSDQRDLYRPHASLARPAKAAAAFSHPEQA